MIRIQVAAVVSAVVLVLTPQVTRAQVPRQPIQLPQKIDPSTLRPDLVARVDTQYVHRTSSSPPCARSGSATTTTRPTVPLSQCAGLEQGQRRNVPVPPLRWGVENRRIVTGTGASNFVVRLTYRTVSGNLVGERVVNETISNLGYGASRFFEFTDPSRLTQYSVSLFSEATTRSTATAERERHRCQVQPASCAAATSVFCVPSVEAIDTRVTVTVNLTDANPANNVLNVP
ncbi:MAG: hypothetical protein U5K74_12425 [Gemmatimonadaceae bacterium]|nr:hypothetical protein [Gemmatimonadaceae bacterium]